MQQENNRTPSGASSSRGTYPPSRSTGSGQNTYHRIPGSGQRSTSQPTGYSRRPESGTARTAGGSSYGGSQSPRTASASGRNSQQGGRPSGGRPAPGNRPIGGGSHYASDRTPATSRAQPPEPPKNPPRRRKRGMGPLGAILYVVLVIGVSALLAGVGWIVAGDVLALNKTPLETVVVVDEGEKIGDVAEALKESGIIEYKGLFKLFAGITHATDDITPGTYTLNTDMDYRALIKNMSRTSGTRSSVVVTIPEGMTLRQIFQLLAEKGVSTVSKLNEIAANHGFKYSFLKDLPTGDPNRLEGYLFPDTYEFYVGGDPLQTINKMILRFDQQFTDEMRARAAEMGYTVAQIVNIASMIEKETDGEDQTIISQVIYNRLERPNNETAGYLNIDATIAYVTGQKVIDTSYDTPYNTAINKGLPPGPIANPGMAAIYAALHPDSDYKKYYYYALGDDGLHHFSKTDREHKNFIATQELYKK